MFSYENTYTVCDFAFFNPDSILDIAPGLRLGSFLANEMAATSLGMPLGAAKSHSRVFFGFGGFQERSKTQKRGFQNGAPKWTSQSDSGYIDLAECAGPGEDYRRGETSPN